MKFIEKALQGIRQNKGSTIVGVIAALAFITVVAAFMVKNTGSQAAASIGYTSDQVMISTVNSGIVATESFFYNKHQLGLDAIEKCANGDSAFIFGGHKSKKQLGPSNSHQFFSSKLLSYNNSSKDARIVFQSAKSSSGKRMKEVRGFYKLMNSKTVAPETESGAVGESVMHASGPVEGNQGMHAKDGGVTFDSTVKIQNFTATFEGDAHFKHDFEIPGSNTVTFKKKVYVGGDTKIDGSGVFLDHSYFDGAFKSLGSATFDSAAYFDKSATFQNGTSTFKMDAYFKNAFESAGATTTFKGKTYFNLNAKMTGATTFDSAVGIRMNYQGGNPGAVNAAGKVYLGGDLRETPVPTYDGYKPSHGYPNIKMTSTGVTNKTFYHTDNLGLLAASCTTATGERVKDVGGVCVTHGDNHINLATNLPNFTLDNLVTMDSARIVDSLKIKIAKKAPYVVNPQIDITRIPESMILSPAVCYVSTRCLGEATMPMPDWMTPMPTGTQKSAEFKTALLTKAYEEAAEAGKLYKDFLILRIAQGDPEINWTGNISSTIFNDKVIFIIDRDANFGNVSGNFYESGPESITLIYVGAGNATLNQFGTSGPFRGLIYIDSANTSEGNSFSWSSGSSIEGAVHSFSKKAFTWNSNGNSPVTMTYNRELLSKLGFLYPPDPSAPPPPPSEEDRKTAELERSSDAHIYPVVGGLYYY